MYIYKLKKKTNMENIRMTKKQYEKVLGTIPNINIINRPMKSTKTKIIETANEVKQAAQLWETNGDIQELKKFINKLEAKKDKELEILVGKQISENLLYETWDSKTLRWQCAKLKIPFNSNTNKTELIKKLIEATPRNVDLIKNKKLKPFEVIIVEDKQKNVEIQTEDRTRSVEIQTDQETPIENTNSKMMFVAACAITGMLLCKTFCKSNQ
jgi:hypothetical protein